MQRLFQTFDRHAVRYLLISGQAAVLYGAASFSEDVDVWIDPSVSNVRAFLVALAEQEATVYKLTPPMTARNVGFGHAFHYLVPDGAVPIYLDVMPRPPRVGTFAASYRRRRHLEMGDAAVEVVSIEDLVELKKTRRLADYDVITTLVSIRLREIPERSRTLLLWAAKNAFRAEDRATYQRLLGKRMTAAASQARLLRELSRLQKLDTPHGSRVIDDLRRLRARGSLLEEGTPVRALLSS